MPSPDRVSLHLASVAPPADLVSSVDAAARSGAGALALDREHLRHEGTKQGARLVRASGLTVTSLGGAGHFTARERQGRRANLDENRRALDEALALGAEALALTSGGLPEGSRDLEGARSMILDGLGELLEDAASAGVRLALLPGHPIDAARSSVVCSARQALNLANELGHDGLGLLVDLHRHWWDADLPLAFKEAGEKKRLFGVRMGDWLPAAPDPLAERGLPGEGVVPLTALARAAEAAGFAGRYELHVSAGEGRRSWGPRELLALALEQAERQVEV